MVIDLTILLTLFTIDPRYHTFNEVAYELDSLVNHYEYSAITHLDTIGYSTVDSLPIFAIKISDNADIEEDEPAILYVACHHAEEILGIEICMYMINDLLRFSSLDSFYRYCIDNTEIWFVPLLNPEGHGVVMSGMDTTWRKNKRDNNNNGIFDLDYDGVDPNRNYDFFWQKGGSSDPPSEYYRGPYPFSENENLALRDLCLSHNFIFCNTYHSARTGLGEVVYYPWQDVTGYPPDYPFIREIADTMSKLIINDQGNGHYYALPGIGVDGRARNWLYGIRGTFCYCIEVSTTTIQPGWMVDDICARNQVGAYHLLNRIRGAGITGCIFDSLTGEPLTAEVIIEGYYDPNLPPRKSEPNYGRFTRILREGTYNLRIQRPGYEPKSYQNIVVTHNRLTKLTIYLNEIGREIKTDNYETGILINPNPTRNIIFIHLNNPSDFSRLRVYDIAGRSIMEFRNPQADLVWPCLDKLNRKIPNGIYWIIGETTETKLIKKIVVYN
jgi:hypothetical protein